MNIHILPTYKASRLQKTKYGNLFLVNKFKSYDNCTPQHIYITSDKEIKPNDWYINNGVIFKADVVFDEGNNPNNSNPRVTDFNKKIILTTDPQLIEDGVQEIDKTFLEWVVKNPSCESVDVKDFPTTEKYNSKGEYIHNSNWIYKIIIPKEEPKPIHQQIIYIVGGEDRFREIANLKPKQETLKKVEENIDREEWIHFFKNNSKEEILEYLIKYKFPL